MAGQVGSQREGNAPAACAHHPAALFRLLPAARHPPLSQDTACPLAYSLQLDGIAAAAESGDGASVFGQAGVLLEMALEEEPALLKDAADKYDRLLDALAAEAEVGRRGQGCVHVLRRTVAVWQGMRAGCLVAHPTASCGLPAVLSMPVDTTSQG